jgi:hypothetical protein
MPMHASLCCGSVGSSRWIIESPSARLPACPQTRCTSPRRGRGRCLTLLGKQSPSTSPSSGAAATTSWGCTSAASDAGGFWGPATLCANASCEGVLPWLLPLLVLLQGQRAANALAARHCAQAEHQQGVHRCSEEQGHHLQHRGLTRAGCVGESLVLLVVPSGRCPRPAPQLPSERQHPPTETAAAGQKEKL